MTLVMPGTSSSFTRYRPADVGGWNHMEDGQELPSVRGGDRPARRRQHYFDIGAWATASTLTST